MNRLLPKIKNSNELGYDINNSIRASVIIVTYKVRTDALIACLDGLRQQSIKDFEIILVENGSCHLTTELAHNLRIRHIQLCDNYGVILARNVGAYYAKGELLIFLDDDGIPANDFVETHINSYENPSIIGVRGKVLPATKKHNEYSSGCYDLGKVICPAMLNVEGNSSVLKANFVNAGGWSTSTIYAHEGIALTYELTQGGILYDRIIYNPKAIIFHDNNKTVAKTLQLAFFSSKNLAMLQYYYPDLLIFMKKYSSSSKKPAEASKRKQLKSINRRKAVLYRLHALCRLLGFKYGTLFVSISERGKNQIVNLDFFNNWPSTLEKQR